VRTGKTDLGCPIQVRSTLLLRKSRYQGSAKIRDINRFHVSQLAYLLTKLKAIPEGDGTLLDHCMVVYGSGNSDGNRHNHDLPVLLAGHGCGTLKPGRHLRYPNETPLNNLWLSLLDRIQIHLPTLRDSTGKLPGLAG